MNRLLLVLLSIGTSLCAPRNTRIFGGDPAAPGQFPFIVALNDPDQYCDGSIINKNWIVTAAHCVEGLDPSTVVLAGTNKEHVGGQQFNVSYWKSHEHFNYDTLINDIGLIKIDGEFTFDDLVQPVEFGDAGPNTSCLAAGWGVSDEEDFPEELQFVELTALSLDDCKEYVLEDTVYLGPEQVCALGDVGKGACYGDSGGPLVSDGKLAGIVSYGMVPCAQGYPDVYTRPSAYLDWINQQIQE